MKYRFPCEATSYLHVLFRMGIKLCLYKNKKKICDIISEIIYDHHSFLCLKTYISLNGYSMIIITLLMCMWILCVYECMCVYMCISITCEKFSHSLFLNFPMTFLALTTILYTLRSYGAEKAKKVHYIHCLKMITNKV